MFDVDAFNAAVKHKGETQEDAAKIMQMNPATLYRKATGQSDFYRKEIEAFCLHYDVPPDSIFFATYSA